MAKRKAERNAVEKYTKTPHKNNRETVISQNSHSASG